VRAALSSARIGTREEAGQPLLAAVRPDEAIACAAHQANRHLFVKGKVMRARRRYVLASFLAAVAVALTSQFGVAQASADPVCPASTSWDDILHRCV